MRARAADVRRLRDRVEALREQVQRDERWGEELAPFVARAATGPRLAGRATPGLLLSRLGIGTSRGPADAETDLAYARAIRLALHGGVNLVDTSIRYRHERSERAVGAALRCFAERDGGARDAVVVCTKGGFLVPGAVPPGLAADDVAGGAHCLSPAFLADQIGRSRCNLGLETIDVYLLHNPEVQLRSVGPAVLRDRLRAAFACLEGAVAEGHVGAYGVATWDGLRGGGLSLRELCALAREAAGGEHHLRLVQLPFNRGMPDALTRRAGGDETVLEVAAELGVAVVGSATLRHAGAEGVPGAIRFALSAPGLASSLVGMRRTAHVAQNLALSRRAEVGGRAR